MEKFQIFISYRRDGGDALAGRIGDRLKMHGYDVFHDVESMLSGPFNEQIYYAIESAQAVLVILSKGALDRCINDDDWVRREIAYAISNNKKIIPVFTNGFSFPDILPKDIDKIRYFEGAHVANEYFDAFIDRICKLMEIEPNKENLTDKDLDSGMRFIYNGLYTKAVEVLEKALENDMSNPEVHFYMSVALLGGKRPFLLPKATIAKVEEHLNTAILIEKKAIYYYLLAFIKKDFYENKMLRSNPNSQQLLTNVGEMGISSYDIDNLFELLKVQHPDDF